MTDHRDLLIVFALQEEAQGLFEKAGYSVLYVGLGKVNAAYATATAIAKRRPRWVLNFGTVGSSVHATHALVECHEFVQRDMDVTPMGFAMGETPFDPLPGIIQMPRLFHEMPSAICGTGDSFETGAPRVPCGVVDMEAYAIAKVCAREGVPFNAVKYVTDGADHQAHNDWKENVHRAAPLFLKAFETALTRISCGT